MSSGHANHLQGHIFERRGIKAGYLAAMPQDERDAAEGEMTLEEAADMETYKNHAEFKAGMDEVKRRLSPQ